MKRALDLRRKHASLKGSDLAGGCPLDLAVAAEPWKA